MSIDVKETKERQKNKRDWVAVIIAFIALGIGGGSLGWQIYAHFKKPEPLYSFDKFEIDTESLKESVEELINTGAINLWAKICLTNLTRHPGRKMKSEYWNFKLEIFEILKKGEIRSKPEVIRETPEFDDGNIQGVLKLGEEVRLVGMQSGWVRIEYQGGKVGWVDRRFLKKTNDGLGKIAVKKVFVRSSPGRENGNRTEREVRPREEYEAIEWVGDSEGNEWVKIQDDFDEKSGFISADNLGPYTYDCKAKQEAEIPSGELDFEFFTAKDPKTKKDIIVQDFESGYIRYETKAKKPDLEIPGLLEIYDQKVISRQMQPAIFELHNIKHLSKEKRDKLLKDKIGVEFKSARQCLIIVTIGFRIVPGLEEVRIIPNEKEWKSILYGIFQETSS